MNIIYKYEIIRVDQAARCMEIIYSSDGRQTMHIGARLPFEGESLESVVQMYAPVAYWREQDSSVVAPAVGSTGSLQAVFMIEQSGPSEDQFSSIFPSPPTGSIQSSVLE
jgi:hypothetical protein